MNEKDGGGGNEAKGGHSLYEHDIVKSKLNGFPRGARIRVLLIRYEVMSLYCLCAGDGAQPHTAPPPNNSTPPSAVVFVIVYMRGKC